MAGKSDIEAGRAFVSLFIKDKGFSKGLNAASQRLRSFGKGVTIFGAAVTAAGTAVVTPLLAMVKSFSDAGSEVFDMAQRTGLSAEAIQALAYAAEQTGTSMKVLEKGIHKAQKEGKSFQEIAETTPKLKGLAKELPGLTKRFKELGLAMSGEDAAAADELGDSIGDLRLVIKSASNAIGAALAPAVTSAVKAITNIAITVRDWVRANKELFVTALKIGVVAMGVGAAITAIGGGMIVAGAAIAAFNTLLAAAATVIAAVVSPIGLVVTGLVGLARWFATSTEWGREFVQTLMGYFGTLLDTAKETFGGIADAIAAGNILLAAEVLWAGLKLAWRQGTFALRETWIGFKNVFMQTTLDLVIGAAKAWETFTGYVESLFIGLEYRAKNAVFSIIGWMSKIGKTDEQKKAIDDAVAFAQKGNRMIAAGEKSESEKATRKALDDLNATRKAAGEQVDASSQKQLSDLAAQLKAAQDALAAAKGQAAQERKDKELGKGPGFKPGEFDLGAGAVAKKVFGSFSAAALAGQSGAGGVDQKQLDELKKIRNENLQHHRKMVAISRGRGLRA